MGNFSKVSFQGIKILPVNVHPPFRRLGEQSFEDHLSFICISDKYRPSRVVLEGYRVMTF